MKTLNDSIAIYQKALRQGDILLAYGELVKFVARIRTQLINEPFEDYSIASLAHGYLDYTYFYYSNDFLKSQKLKLGLVLNHLEMQFEIWLLGNTQPVQQRYWQLFKDTPWAAGKEEKPEYAIIEVVIADNPNFDKADALTEKIKKATKSTSEEIQAFLKEKV